MKPCNQRENIMKNFKSLFTLFFSLYLISLIGFTSLSMAQETSAVSSVSIAASTTASVAEVVATDAAVTPVVTTTVATVSAEVAAPVVVAPMMNKGDIAWMMVSTLLVVMMAIPGLALFYGGLVRSKNMLSVLMQVFMIFSLIVVLWCVYGYSLAFTEGNAFVGGFDRVFLNGIWDPVHAKFSTAATFTKGVVLPEFVFVAFQATFAAVTCGLIVGAFAERAKFKAVLAFIVIWFTFSYLPIAHMVWFWTGPDAIQDAVSLATESAKAGYLWQKGAFDFAGGTVVHINAAIAGLVGAIMIGKRVGYGREAMAPHSLTMTMIGASLLWVGWFGFNAGSAYEANDIAALAFVNTLLATAAATVSWVFGEWISKGKPSMLGGASGAVAGLVAITPACGFVGPMGALVIGLLSGIVCLWGVNGLKRLIGADDTLDVFGVHGVGGILGALLTGVFASPSLGGQGVFDYVTNAISTDPYSIIGQVTAQATAIGVTVVWSGVVSIIAFKVVDLIIGLRVPEDEEREGLDITSHGESAYHS
jgi:Amt family ammonium transporter